MKKTPDYSKQIDQLVAMGIPKDDAWLRQISDYGNARMAKKAIGVLDKMRSFNIKPNIIKTTYRGWGS